MSIRHIVLIPGDGVGPEVVAAARLVLEQLSVKGQLGLTLTSYWAGGAAIDRCGEPLPPETLAAVRAADAILLGAVGGPQWDSLPPASRPETAILGLRKALGLFANLRPVRIPESLTAYSPLKPEVVGGVDILIVRELSGGIYFGPRSEAQVLDGVEQARDTEIYSTPEIARIVRVACEAARKRRRRVTSVDKANVLASSRLWRRVTAATAQDYADVELDHLYVDNCAMQLMLAPKQFDVIVTSNLFGDILSDEAAVTAGSIGLLPSASIGDGPGLYEPIHGSAPTIAGQGVANPIGTILSAAMLLRFSLGEPAAADRIERAVDKVLAEGYRTSDLYRPGLTKVSTQEMAGLIADRL